MGTLKLATFNAEWMIALFGLARDADWLARPVIPDRFAGGQRGSIRFAPIDDVPALCRRLAGTLRAVDADIVIVQEGPPLAEQMALFVERFLDDAYVVQRSNRSDQAIFALVRRALAPQVRPWLPPGRSAADLWKDIPYYEWGRIGTADRRQHDAARQPLLLAFEPSARRRLILCGVHTKSKFSRLKTVAQWQRRDTTPGPVLDALTTRQKLAAEVARLRAVIGEILALGPEFAHVVTLGDFNDGPFADLMEAEFLTQNILDQLVGSLREPNTYLRHAMEPARLARSASTHFRDPLRDGALVEELIDHILVSPGIWSGRGRFRVRRDSCVVEDAAWQAQVGPAGPEARADRPSDHKPVSVVIDWKD
jgi:endonuclease/exonuclease/phosphatase family metal-dependent hydrolase